MTAPRRAPQMGVYSKAVWRGLSTAVLERARRTQFSGLHAMPELPALQAPTHHQ